MIKGSLMLHLGPIWYHSEPSDVPYSQNFPRPISWIGLFIQQNDSSPKKEEKKDRKTKLFKKGTFIVLQKKTSNLKKIKIRTSKTITYS